MDVPEYLIKNLINLCPKEFHYLGQMYKTLIEHVLSILYPLVTIY